MGRQGERGERKKEFCQEKGLGLQCRGGEEGKRLKCRCKGKAAGRGRAAQKE